MERGGWWLLVKRKRFSKNRIKTIEDKVSKYNQNT